MRMCTRWRAQALIRSPGLLHTLMPQGSMIDHKNIREMECCPHGEELLYGDSVPFIALWPHEIIYAAVYPFQVIDRCCVVKAV